MILKGEVILDFALFLYGLEMTKGLVSEALERSQLQFNAAFAALCSIPASNTCCGRLACNTAKDQTVND